MAKRTPNTMVPYKLLARLREAQRAADPERIRAAVAAIDRAVGFDPRGPRAAPGVPHPAAQGRSGPEEG